MKGRHQRRITAPEAINYQRELEAYKAWCQKKGYDPNSEAVAHGYETIVGFLFIDPNPAWAGEHKANV